MVSFLINILLALAWMALTGEIAPSNFLIGFLLGYGLLWLGQPVREPTTYFLKVRQLSSLIGFFLIELLKANFRVAFDVISFRQRINPGVVAIPLDVKSDLEITLLANLITLTPGTLSLDVSSDRQVLYVHSMYIGDVAEFRRQIKEGFERRIQEVFR